MFLDGAFIPRAQAAFSPSDSGLLYGLGTFETLRLYDGVPFIPERHEARLRAAAETLGITPPSYGLKTIFMELSRRNDLPDARGRALLTGGDTPPGDSGPRFYAELAPLASERGTGDAGAESAGQGVAAILISEIPTGVPRVSGIKTLSYLPNHLARCEAERVGANEAILMTREGELLEGATSNFFVVIEGCLMTPPTEGRILPGITREVVIEEATAMKLPLETRSVWEQDLSRAEEVFLTSTLREVLPVRQIGNRRFRAPGTLTGRLAAAYRRRVVAYLKANRSR